MNRKVNVLFVCMGNICRSPAAEGVFRAYIKAAGFDGMITVDSAGTIAYHAGHPPDGRMVEAAARRGYILTSLARQVTRVDFEDFDLMIAMDRENLMDLEQMANGPRRNIRLLGTFLNEASSHGAVRSVPDPYYGGAAGFESVLDMIEEACPAILDQCLELLQTKAG